MAVSVKANVVVCSANGDTVAGPLEIESIKVVGGSTNGTASLSIGGITVYSQPGITANQALYADEVPISMKMGDTLTAALTGTGTTIYIYLA